MNKKNTHGGKRKKAGRKPIDDKKKTISLYIRESTIFKYGGEENLKDNIYTYLSLQNVNKL